MEPITIPESLRPSFKVTIPTQICDESGKVLGYYTPFEEASDHEYERAQSLVTASEIQESLESGPGRPFMEVVADMRRRFHS